MTVPRALRPTLHLTAFNGAFVGGIILIGAGAAVGVAAGVAIRSFVGTPLGALVGVAAAYVVVYRLPSRSP